jgi:hypothetical protein
MRMFLPVVALVAVIVAASAPLQAAAAPENEDHHPLFDKIDANHDGFISLAEWEAWRDGHHRREAGAGGGANAGAHLTMNSLAHGTQGTPGATGGAGTPPTGTATVPTPPVHPHGNAANNEERHPLFDRIDTNHDGKISLAEWIAWREAHPHHRKQPAP